MTAALAVLEALATRRIMLYTDSAGTLRARGPRGAYTPADRAAVAVHRVELVALLRARARLIYQEGARPPGLLRLVLHEHCCPACSRSFRCTAPSCAGQPIRCICCVLDSRPATR
jgi:hypothetical protein